MISFCWIDVWKKGNLFEKVTLLLLSIFHSEYGYAKELANKYGVINRR